MAALLRRRDERIADRQPRHVGDGERPAGVMKFIRAALLVLRLAEVGKHVGITPAGIAELAPAIEVLGLPANVQQPVDRR